MKSIWVGFNQNFRRCHQPSSVGRRQFYQTDKRMWVAAAGIKEQSQSMLGSQRVAQAKSGGSRENDFLQTPIGQHLFTAREGTRVAFDLSVSLATFRPGALPLRFSDFMADRFVIRNQPKRILLGNSKGGENISLDCWRLSILHQAKRLALRSNFHVIKSFR